MNIEEVKTIRCTDYLISIGLNKDVKSNNNFSFFKSPFREERTASLSVNERKNVWFDYGSGFGGDVIKLKMLCENKDFKSAMNDLSGSKFSRTNNPVIAKSSLIIEDVRELTNSSLLNYLANERRINIDLAKKYLKEVHFTNKGKSQYAIGFENDKGGFELRNKFMKVATSPKWVTTIKGGEVVNVFEGFMDFLSAMTYWRKEPSETVVVLNSATLIDKINIDGLVRFWGDNDKAGDECFAKIKGRDERKLFKGYKDFNEFICSR